VTEPACSVPREAADVIAERDRTIARLERDLDSLRDILLDYMTAREQAEDEMRATEDRYRALVHRAASGIFRAALDGRFTDVNPALVQTLGYPSAAMLLSAPAGAVFYDPADYQRILGQALGDEHRGWTEVRWRRFDGAPILVRLSLQVVKDGRGNATALEGMTEDITDRARQEDLLRRSERMASLGHMLAGVAHELNNPLAAIGGFAQLMLRQQLSDEDRSGLETINHEAQRAARIVRDLLAFSRRHEQERREAVDLNEVVRYILDAQRYQIETRGIRRTLSLAAALPPVMAQASQLEQVVLNLVVNARQALEQAIDQQEPARRPAPPAAPAITIRTASQGGTVTLEVEDNGPGIPEEYRTRIWDPFWTSKEEGEGTGLGLAVVHGIVTTYGGTIDLETQVGVGTRFIVRLPAASARDHTSATPPPAAPHVSPQRPSTAAPRSTGPRRAAVPLRILVVDDEKALLELLDRYFSARGHTVTATPNGLQAIDLAQRQSFDIVICDLRMPALDGGEVIRQLRMLPTCSATRYIVSTGSSALPDDLTEAAPGATLLVKPYDIEELRQAVELPSASHAH
jgi:PAS domain S-box-containing protein